MGPQEMLLVVAVLAVAFGWGRVPQIGQSLARSLLNFQRALKGTDEIDVTPPEPKLEEAAEKPTDPPRE